MNEQQLTPIIKQSFEQFAGAVLQSRALVDVRDCIKPSARQIFYCMETDNFIHSKPFQKTLKAIGSCFRLYIHGDSSAEGVIMRAGQPFAYRYPLVEVEGSYGTLISSGSWAAPRYSSARLSPLADYLFDGLKKETITEWRDNYDNTEKYPSVLPSKGFYNIVNGCFGLGVGASSSIPQYNLRELNNALIYLIDHPDCSFDEIYCAPDYATGATIINGEEVKEAHRNGTGAACRIRSTVDWNPSERCFIVTEIPYMVYTNTICGELEEIINGEDNPGIERFNDLTGKNPLIKIYLTKNANSDKVLRYLYKNTSLESFYGVNLTMLDNHGRFPRVFGWKEALQAHIDHEREVYINGFNFDLRKIENRLHIINGLLKAISMIEEVIKTIKGSNDTKMATAALKQLLGIDDVQAKAILDIKLARLAHLEINKLEKEKNDLISERDHIQSILDSETLLNNEIKKGLREVSEKFGDERRTKILNLSKNSNEEPIEIKSLQISITNKNRIFAVELSTLYTQKRGGVGNKFKLEQNEYVIDSIATQSDEELLFFSQNGIVYHYNANDIAVGEKVELCALLNLKQEENICAITSISKNSKTNNIIFITKKGFIKKSSTEEYNINRKVGIKAISLEEGDEIVKVLFTNEDKIGLLTEKGNFLMIRTDDITPIGRVAKGVHAIKLSDDFVAAAHIIPNNTKFIASISGNGLFKQTEFSEFYVQNRNTKGSKLQKINSGDWMVDFLPIINDSEILIMATKTCIKLTTRDIPITSRGAIGNKSIKLNDTENVIGFCIN